MNKLNWKLIQVVLQVIAMIPVGGKDVPVQEEPPDLAVTMAKIIKSCYADRVKTIGIAGNFSNSFIATMWEDDPISIVLLSADDSSMSSSVVSEISGYKLQLFAITATSSVELKKILIHVKNSRWWNHMAQFYLFDSARKPTGCSNRASKFLWTAWTMDILGAKYICNQSVERPLIFTFNPYTQHAPAPWKKDRTRKGVNDHLWTLFVREYSENTNICETIDFDPTKDAGGYEMRLSGRQRLRNPTNISELSKFRLPYTMLHLLSHYMNISVRLVAHRNKNASIGFVDEKGKIHGLVEDFTDNRSDMVFGLAHLTSRTFLTGAYPIQNSLFFAVTQHTSFQPQWRKVISAIDSPSRIGLCIVILVNVIVLKYVLRQTLGTAVLNTLRMICNSCFPKLPENMGPRIYLACLLCFVVTVQALYQGQLSALLTKRIRYPNINNRKDLVSSHHDIYGRYEDIAVFNDPILKDRFIGIDIHSNKCTDLALQNSSIACVGIREILMKGTLNSKLHMSKNPIAETPMFWPNRKNWPLEDRASRHSFHYVESGLYDYHQKTIYAEATRTLEANENENSGEDFRILTLEDLDFAFVILGFGLGCAIISFVVELLILKRGRLSRKKRRVRFRRWPRFYFKTYN